MPLTSLFPSNQKTNVPVNRNKKESCRLITGPRLAQHIPKGSSLFFMVALIVWSPFSDVAMAQGVGLRTAQSSGDTLRHEPILGMELRGSWTEGIGLELGLDRDNFQQEEYLGRPLAISPLAQTESSRLLKHQPVMDMAPRWAGGYGIQFRYENWNYDRLQSGGSGIGNPEKLYSETSILWVEGVYTFTRGRRLTFKMPFADSEGRQKTSDGTGLSNSSGPGDLILGFQNKRYFNKAHYTGNISFTPSVRLPTGSFTGRGDVSRGTLDVGISLSVSVETFKLYTYLDVFSWFATRERDGRRPGNTYAFDIDVGIHPYHNMEKNMGIFVMTGLNGRYYSRDKLSTGERAIDAGGRTFEVAPTLVLYKDNVMLRAQYHVPVYQDLFGIQLERSPSFQIGIGMTFQSFSPI